MESLRKQAANLLREQKKYRRWLAVFLCLAILVTSGTIASLMMKGQALNKQQKVLECPLVVHEHTAECYKTDAESGEQKLACGYADYVVHVHGDECRDEEGTVVCGLPEAEAHVHEEGCFESKSVLVCTEPETQGHIHTEECRTLICGKEESQGHVHAEGCKTLSQGTLICENAEEGHEHVPECWEQTETITCGLEEGAEAHAHTEECYNLQGCGLAEGEGGHAHTLACYEIRQSVICGKLELHTHVREGENSCCDTAGNLICGIPELKEHVHGDDCFRVVEEEKPDEIDNAGAEEESPEDKTAENLPSEDKTAEEDTAAADSEKDTPTESQEEAETEADSEEDQTAAAGTDQNSGGENSDMESADTSAVGEKCTLTAGGEDYTVTVTYGADAQIPEGTELNVREILEGTEEYDDYYQQMLAAVDSEKTTAVSSARFFDITFLSEGEKIEPSAPVDIRVSYQDAVEMGEGANASAVHFAKDGTEILDAEVVEAEEGSDFAFTQSSFSVSGIIITDDPEPFMEGILEVQEGDYKITVTYDAEAEIPQDAVLTAEEIGMDSGAYDSYYQSYAAAVEGMTISQARFFTLSLTEEAGNPIAAKTPVNVKIQYDAPVVFADSEIPAMAVFAQVDAGLLGASSVEAESQTDSFETQVTFDGENAVVAGTVVAGVPADEEIMAEEGEPDPDVDLSKYLKSEGPNDWQIVEQGYVGRAPENKILSTDENIQVQKNVIPTEVENEFLVYLSVDVKQLYKEFFETAKYLAVSSNSNKDVELGDVSYSMPGSAVYVSPDKAYDNWATFTIVDSNGVVVGQNIKLGWDHSNNCTFYIELPESSGVKKYIVIGTSIKKYTNNTIKLTEAMEDSIASSVSQLVHLDYVTDQMGQYIEYWGVIDGDYTEEPSFSNGILTWKPTIKKKPEVLTIETTTDSGITSGGQSQTKKETTQWALNVSELVYKVRLNVTKEGFQSCAATIDDKEQSPKYQVNEKATIFYGDNELDFPVPYVRGLLYDISMTKKEQDEDGNKTDILLRGAKFEIKSETGSTFKTEISDEQGNVCFYGLPWGRYTVTEIEAPEGYEISESAGFDSYLCYTTDKENNVLIPNGSNMIRAEGGKEYIPVIYNRKKPAILVKKEWEDNDNREKTRPESVTFIIKDGIGENANVLARQVLPDVDGNWYAEVRVPRADQYYVYEENIPKYYEVLKGEETFGDAILTTDGGKKIYTITNKLKDRQVQILKIAELPDAEGNLIYLNGATFEVYDRDWSLDENKDAVPLTGIGPWTSKTNDKGQEGVLYEGKLKVGTYWLKEVTAPENYELLTTSIKIEVSALTEGDSEIQSITIANRPAGQQVKILKKAAEGESVYLDGAEFEVYNEEPNSGVEPIDKWISTTLDDQKGVIFAGLLKTGTYWLVETKAPDGYHLPSAPFVINVQPKGINMNGSVTCDNNGVYIIEISNSAGFELPETGSIGTNPYTIGGAMLATAAAFLMYGYSMRRRKSERRSK